MGRTTTFVVTGKFPFPVDMLRYDVCWPVDQDSAREIEASINRERDENGKLPLRRITLSSINLPTEGRWESFNWNVAEYIF
jgi:hypothetical protein